MYLINNLKDIRDCLFLLLVVLQASSKVCSELLYIWKYIWQYGLLCLTDKCIILYAHIDTMYLLLISNSQNTILCFANVFVGLQWTIVFMTIHMEMFINEFILLDIFSSSRSRHVMCNSIPKCISSYQYKMHTYVNFLPSFLTAWVL